MADEEDPWAFDDGGDQPVPVAESEIASNTPAPALSTGRISLDENTGYVDTEKSVDVTEGETGLAASQPPPPPLEDDGYRKPVQLYRHWVRPKFLQYKYMYNYRTNYYDDVIDYLDKKQVGVMREIPRPQTWAERVLRTNNTSAKDLDCYSSVNKRDKQLIQTLAASIRTHNYHTKAYINQKYARVL